MAGAEGSIAPESGLFREQIGHIADRGTHHVLHVASHAAFSTVVFVSSGRASIVCRHLA